MEARLVAELVGDAQELRCARRLELNVDFLLLLHDAREHILILLSAQRLLFDGLRTARRHEEEEVMGLRADLDSKVRHGLELALVPVHDRRVDLERQSDGRAVLHALHGAFPAAREAAERVVLLRVERIERDTHRTGTGFLELLRHVERDQRAVRAEDRDHVQVRGVLDELEDIGAHQRLAARKDHDLEAGFGNLRKELLALLRTQLFFCLAAGIAVAVRTVHIAGIRRIPRDDLHFVSSVSPISSSVK